jgi:hypothetical protein
MSDVDWADAGWVDVDWVDVDWADACGIALREAAESAEEGVSGVVFMSPA